MLVFRAARSRRIRLPRRRPIGRSQDVGRSFLRSRAAISSWTNRVNTGSVRSAVIQANLDQASATQSARRRWRAGSGVHREGRQKKMRPFHREGAQHKQRYLCGPTNVLQAQTTRSDCRRDPLTGFAFRLDQLPSHFESAVRLFSTFQFERASHPPEELFDSIHQRAGRRSPRSAARLSCRLTAPLKRWWHSARHCLVAILRRDPRVSDFAMYEQARRSAPPNRVRHPTDRQFTSGCSPPRLATAW